MILQRLNELAERLTHEPSSGFPKEGFSKTKINYEVVLSKNGEVVSINDLTESDQKKNSGKVLDVPKEVGRSRNILSNKTWDKGEYVFGAKETLVDESSREKFLCFKETHLEYFKKIEQPSEVVLTFSQYLKNWQPEEALKFENWPDMFKGNFVFRVDGNNSYLHEDKGMLKEILSSKDGNEDAITSQCLVSGQQSVIARLHLPIKGLWGGQSSGSPLTSFNENAFESYNKDQGNNAPVSELVVINYCNALNWLLKKENHQKIQLNDTSVVFWSEKKSPLEDCFSQLFGEEIVEGSELQIRSYLQAITKGKKPSEFEVEMPFFILGMVANAARSVVKFWHESNVGTYLELIEKHYNDIAIERQWPDKESEFPSLYELLSGVISKKKKFSDLPKKIGSDFLRAVITGQPYPSLILPLVLRRVCIDDVNYYKVALIKGVINRNRRLFQKGKELPMSLDEDRNELPYVLGRIFACLERAQGSSQGKVNASIRDKYFSSASTRPSIIYPQLLSLYQHHLKKGGEKMIYIDKIISSLMDKTKSFPKTMSTEEQGVFTIGYYHQRNSFFKKKEEV